MFSTYLKPFFIFLPALFILTLFSCNVKKKIFSSGITTNLDSYKNINLKDSIEKNNFSVETKINKIDLEDKTLVASTNEKNVYFNTSKKSIFDSRINLSNEKPLIQTKNKALKVARVKTKDSIALDEGWRMVSITIGLLIIILALFAFLTSNISVGIIFSVLAILAILIGVSNDVVSEAILNGLALIYQGILSIFRLRL